MSDHAFPRIAAQLGVVGRQMTTLGAAEGAAGNLSVFSRELHNLDLHFSARGEWPLPVVVPELAGGWLIISGSSRRLRDIADDVPHTLLALQIQPGGQSALRYAAEELRPSSELNSHLAIHADQVARRGVSWHCVLHAQPFALTYLSHLPAYADPDVFNQRLLRWQPETILVFPEGIGVLGFQAPSSTAQMQTTVQGLRLQHAIIWQRHGIVVRHDSSLIAAADLVEYAETAARFELQNLQLGNPASGLSPAELREICTHYGVRPTVAFLADG